MSRLIRTAHASHRLYKGAANYFLIVAGGATADNAVWSYEQPFPAMAEITVYFISTEWIRLKSCRRNAVQRFSNQTMRMSSRLTRGFLWPIKTLLPVTGP
jgi:hypothetical protein